jgi:hypothetical protein
MMQTANTTCRADEWRDFAPDPKTYDVEITAWTCTTTYPEITAITQSTASTTAGFTYGEIVNSLFLFLILLTLIFGFFVFKFFGFKIHKSV